MSHLYILFTESSIAKTEGGLQDFMRCKIGITDNCKARFSQLQTGIAEPIAANTWKVNDPRLLEEAS